MPATTAIPSFTVKFKNESLLMRVIGFLLFFNPSFMTSFTTTLGSTVYFPSRAWLDNRQLSSKPILVHELVHVKDSNNLGPVFGLLYGLPQILAPLSLLLLLVTKWWLVLVIFALLASPLPALGRSWAEKRGYSFSLYAWYVLATKYQYPVDFDLLIQGWTKNFTGSAYYWMCPWMKRDYFDNMLVEFKHGLKPGFDQEYFDMADEMLEILQRDGIMTTVDKHAPSS